MNNSTDNYLVNIKISFSVIEIFRDSFEIRYNTALFWFIDLYFYWNNSFFFIYFWLFYIVDLLLKFLILEELSITQFFNYKHKYTGNIFSNNVFEFSFEKILNIHVFLLTISYHFHFYESFFVKDSAFDEQELN